MNCTKQITTDDILGYHIPLTLLKKIVAKTIFECII